jgi:mono/diheme cytochrome c family protein
MKRVVVCLLAAVVVAASLDSFVARIVAAQAPAESGVPSQSVWQGVYTGAQAVRGQASYLQSCSRCHAVDAAGVASRFSGDKFWAAWGEAPLDRLYGYLRRSMPNDAPGTLSEATYADITAFLLRGNGIPAGDRELTGDAVAAIRLAPRDSDGSLPDGAFVAVSGCLAKRANSWLVTHAGAPARSSSTASAAAAAAAIPQQFGDGAFQLLYVIAPLDAMVGHQVVVRGLLVRQPAAAVNVMTVDSVSPNCAPALAPIDGSSHGRSATASSRGSARSPLHASGSPVAGAVGRRSCRADTTPCDNTNCGQSDIVAVDGGGRDQFVRPLTRIVDGRALPPVHKQFAQRHCATSRTAIARTPT